MLSQRDSSHPRRRQWDWEGAGRESGWETVVAETWGAAWVRDQQTGLEPRSAVQPTALLMSWLQTRKENRRGDARASGPSTWELVVDLLRYQNWGFDFGGMVD